MITAPGSGVQDVIHARPARLNKHGDLIPGRFDTALVRVETARSDIQRFRVAQVRAVFTLPPKVMAQLFPRLEPAGWPRYLIYVEWFTKFTSPHPDHGLYKISRSTKYDSRLDKVVQLGEVMTVDDLERSCHLIPDFS